VAPTREFLSRCPPRVFPGAAAVTLLVVLVTYGFQRQAELAPTPAERPPVPSPMIEAPVPSPEPIAKSEPSILPLAPDPPPPSPGHGGERITSPRPQAKSMARLHDARPRVARDAVAATARKPSAAWIIGHTKDEQIAPEPEPVRRDRD
jgi:hypothetical protein